MQKEKPLEKKALSGSIQKKIFRPAARCLSRFNHKDGTVQLIDISDQMQTYSIDGVAALVWQHLNGKRSIQKITEVIFEEYDVPEKILLRDIENFVADLTQLKLIQEI